MESSTVLDPVVVVRGGQDPDRTTRWSGFCTEVLAHAGLPHTVADRLPYALDPAPVLFQGTPTLSAAELDRLDAWLRAGGTAFAVGDPGALGELTGVTALGTVAEGCVRGDELLPDGHLRGFGGVELQPAPASEVLLTWQHGARRPAAVRTPHGRGAVVLFGVDVWQSVVRIVQGWPVDGDGTPAPDGTVPLADGIMRCDDGIALSYEEDRNPPAGQPPLAGPYEYVFPPEIAPPMFDRPQADLWRDVLLRVLLEAWSARAPVALLDYWPRGATACVHLSLDADGNDEDDAQFTLSLLAGAGLTATWCQLYPGYEDATLAKIAAADHEIGLHFDARTDSPETRWSQDCFRLQHGWLTGTDPDRPLVANKNHYTRWEGWTQLFRWCEDAGIQIDETRGPAKLGEVGFPFGTCHPWFPMADDDEGNRPIDVLALPLHTQDLGIAAHPSVRDVILDKAEAHHGVAHFLFHPQHLGPREYVRAELLGLARAVADRGLPWLTAGEINRWERARRTAAPAVRTSPDGTITVSLPRTDGLDQPALAVLVPDPEKWSATIGGAPVPTTVITRHGHRMLQVVLADGGGDVALARSDGAAA